jgi:hypothetical protein
MVAKAGALLNPSQKILLGKKEASQSTTESTENTEIG